MPGCLTGRPRPPPASRSLPPPPTWRSRTREFPVSALVYPACVGCMLELACPFLAAAEDTSSRTPSSPSHSEDRTLRRYVRNANRAAWLLSRKGAAENEWTVGDAASCVTVIGSSSVTVIEPNNLPSKRPTRPVDQYFVITAGADTQALSVSVCSSEGNYSLVWWNGSIWVDVGPHTVGNGCESATFLGGDTVPTTHQLKDAVFAVTLGEPHAAPIPAPTP